MSYVRALPLALLVAGCGSNGNNPPPMDLPLATRSLILLHTNDEHSHLIGFGPEADDYPAATSAGTGAIHGGIGRRAVLLTQERQAAATAGAATLTVSAGDNMMGTLTEVAGSSIAPDFTALKKLGYDVVGFGNHEFDWGPANLAAIIGAAQANGGLVPTVASNIHFSSTDAGDDALAALFDESGTDMSKPVHRSLVVTASNGLKVGFVGIVGADAQNAAPFRLPVQFSQAASGMTSDTAGVLAALYKDIQPVVDHLRNDEKVDLVVALSHSGVDLSDDTKGEDWQIALNVTGIDVIVSGHSHTNYPAKVVTNPTSNKPVLIQQAGQFGEFLGRIAINVTGSDVTFDMANSKVLPVDDTIVADPTYNASIDRAIDVLESTKLSTGKSFLEGTISALVGSDVAHNPQTPGDLYFYQLGATGFDVIGQTDHKENPLLVLSADSMLDAVDQLAIGTTDVAVQARGVIRADLQKGKTGNIAFGDIFRILPLGISTKDGTVGYPLCRFGVLAAELKAAMEVSAGASYTSDNASEFFLEPSGIKVEYDTSRPMFNPAGSPIDPGNGRVTKITFAMDHTAAGIDTYPTANVIWDASQGGFVNGITPLTLYTITTSLYIASFANANGIDLKSPDGQMTGLTPEQTIVTRTDGSEVKDFEALSGYILSQSAANSGQLPSRYDASTATFPRRMICSGPLCVP